MRFVSRFTQIDYVVQPGQVQFTPYGTKLPNTPSVTAKFKNHMFDSAVAQKQNHWSDELRDRVERHLQSHGDMGNGLYVEGMQPDTLIATPEQLARGMACVATITSPDGSTIMCGKRPVIRDDMCAEHVAQFLPAEPSTLVPGTAEPVEEEEEPIEEFVCEDCGKVFNKAQGLKMHRIVVHKERAEVSA